MERIIDATSDGKVFRPDEPVELASNVKVKIVLPDGPKKLELKTVKNKKTGHPYAFFEYLQSLDLEGPEDWSTNLDDYLYHGKPFPDQK
jgi:predicted DNA-binding antitoxin AbrB/MazE fold protein